MIAVRRPGLRFFGHPAHAALSDAPVALPGSSVVWDAAGLVRGDELWRPIGFWPRR
jgi:hypothetical protein